MSIKKLPEIIFCKTPSEHALSDTRLIGNALLTSFLFSTLSVCEPTPGDYKLRNPIEHTFIDWRIIKEVVQRGRVIELIPPLL